MKSHVWIAAAIVAAGVTIYSQFTNHAQAQQRGYGGQWEYASLSLGGGNSLFRTAREEISGLAPLDPHTQPTLNDARNADTVNFVSRPAHNSDIEALNKFSGEGWEVVGITSGECMVVLMRRAK